MDWSKLCRKAITMVRGGEGLGGWKGDYRKGRLYENDALWTKKQSLLKGLGGEMIQKLNAKGLTKMSDLKLTCMNEDLTKTLVAAVDGLDAKKMSAWRTIFETTIILLG